MWVAGNEYLQLAAPWTAWKTDRAAAAVGVRTGINACVLFAILAQPFIPDAATTVLDALGVADEQRRWPRFGAGGWLDALARGHALRAPEILFKKIEDTDVAEWTARFGGGF